MKSYSLSHLSDQTLLRDLATVVAQERGTTAVVLAHIAEVDARRLYLPAAYPSMFAYCVGELRLSEDSAFKRIQAARVARRFPAIFDALAEGRLHLSAVGLLAPHVNQETVDELLVVATHKSKSEIEQLLAERFSRPDVPARVQAIAPAFVAPGELAPGQVGNPFELAPGQVGENLQLAPGPVPAFADRGRVTPLSPESFAVQFTMSRCAHDKLHYAQELLSHQLPAGDIADVFERALDALVGQLEKRKFAATARPRASRRRARVAERTIPAHVRRAVWERDGGQCTFVSQAGRRCEARKFLEYDHIDEVARGGEATVGRMRLRCRAHNQYGAECSFGTEFMRGKRQHAAEARAAAQARRAAQAALTERERAAAAERAARAEHDRVAAAHARDRDVIPWLRQLGFRADEARCAATLCEHIPDAPLEERVRVALSHFQPKRGPRGRTVGVSAAMFATTAASRV